MRLYHGSNVEVASPRLLRSDRRLDFGPGFYLTSSLDQAPRWAVLTARRRGTGSPIVSAFELDEARLGGLSVLRFAAPTVEWLRYVGENRQGESLPHDHDIVVGPVANDTTMPVLRLFFSGVYTEEEAIRRLLPQRLADQYACKTQAALDALGFLEAREA